MTSIDNLIGRAGEILDDASEFYETRSRIEAKYDYRAQAEMLAREYRAGLEILPDLFTADGKMFVNLDAKVALTESFEGFREELTQSNFFLLSAKVSVLLRAIRATPPVVSIYNAANVVVTKH